MVFLFGKDIYCNNDLIPVLSNGKLGYIDTNGIRIPPQFDVDYEKQEYKSFNRTYVGYKLDENCRFSEGKAIVKKRYYFLFIWLYDKYYVIDTNANELTLPKYDGMKSFRNGLAPVMFAKRTFFSTYDSKWGYISIKNQESKDIIYEEEASIDGIANDLLIDTIKKDTISYEKIYRDTLTIDTIYNFAGLFSDGFALTIQKDSSIFFIDTSGQLLNNVPYLYAWSFSESFAAVKEKDYYEKIDTVASPIGDEGEYLNQYDLFGYIDTIGKYVIEPEYKYAWSFKSGVARVCDGKYFFYIDKKNRKLPTGDFTLAEDFSDGMALVKIDNKYGYIDSTGAYAIEPQYAIAQAFSNGLAPVFSKGKWGFINKKNEWVILPQYDFARGFIKGAAEVWQGKNYYLISKGNRIIWKYD